MGLFEKLTEEMAGVEKDGDIKTEDLNMSRGRSSDRSFCVWAGCAGVPGRCPGPLG